MVIMTHCEQYLVVAIVRLPTDAGSIGCTLAVPDGCRIHQNTTVVIIMRMEAAIEKCCEISRGNWNDLEVASE